MYGKIIKGQLETAPKYITIRGKNIWNASADQMLSKGWKHVVFSNCPEAPVGFYYECAWEESETDIVQIWVLKEQDELEPFDALQIILGGAE